MKPVSVAQTLGEMRKVWNQLSGEQEELRARNKDFQHTCCSAEVGGSGSVVALRC